MLHEHFADGFAFHLGWLAEHDGCLQTTVALALRPWLLALGLRPLERLGLAARARESNHLSHYGHNGHPAKTSNISPLFTSSSHAWHVNCVLLQSQRSRLGTVATSLVSGSGLQADLSVP